MFGTQLLEDVHIQTAPGTRRMNVWNADSWRMFSASIWNKEDV